MRHGFTEVELYGFAGGRWVAGGLAAYAAILVGAILVLQWSADPGGAPSPLRSVSLESASPVNTIPVEIRVTPVAPLPVAPAPADAPQRPGTGAVGHRR